MKIDVSNLAQVVFAISSALVCLAVLVYAIRRRLTIPKNIPADESREQRCKAIEFRLDLSTKLFDVGVILLGVLWGLVLTEKITIEFSHGTDVVLFVSSNILLLFSLFFHLLYKRRVATLLWDLAPRQPNIFSEHVDYLFRSQWIFFFASLVAGCLTLFSVKILGEG